MKIHKFAEALIIACMVVIFILCGWYLARHPEIAAFDELLRASGRGQ